MNHELRHELAEKAKTQPPLWTGDLEDDCTAQWGGLLLRAESMNEKIWWWAVTEIATNLEINSSNNDDLEVDSGVLARRLAESAACDFLGISADYTNE